MSSWLSSWFGSSNEKEPDATQAKILQEHRILLNTAFIEGNPEHEEWLSKIWDQAFPGVPIEKTSKKWKQVGFQREEPRSDIRGGGILCLRHLLFFFRSKLGDRARAMIVEQMPRAETNYPWAAVGINLTRMLCDAFNISDNKFSNARRGYWAIFSPSRPEALDEMYAETFVYFDKVWRARGATYMQFAQVLDAVKQKVAAALAKNPTTVEEYVAFLNA